MTLNVIVTGASSGIGHAIAALFEERGDRVFHGSRRGGSGQGVRLDVRDRSSIERFVAGALDALGGRVDVLVNNAGLALGLEPTASADPEDWDRMIDTNIRGLLGVTRAVLPHMLAAKHGHVIQIGSIAGHQVYEGGGVYCATKAAVHSISKALRLELCGSGVRLTIVDPGMVETEFSEVRFKGEIKRAAKVYAGMRPLTARDVAECVAFAVDRPPHVNIDQMIVMPTDQASVGKVHRTG